MMLYPPIRHTPSPTIKCPTMKYVLLMVECCTIPIIVVITYATIEMGLKINHGKNSSGRFVSAPKIRQIEKMHCRALATAITIRRHRNVSVSGSRDLSVISTSS
uniref:Uncharacterized protein n=1 Tax=Photinus pyralis TaxID=7054 RepID=A0A1Y1LJ33_PHOPY